MASAGGGLRRGRPFNVGRVAGGGFGSAFRMARITSAAAVVTRRVSWNRHNWCAAVGQISASTLGYSAEPSVITWSGWIPAAARRRRKAAVVAWSTAPCTSWYPTSRSPSGAAGSTASSRASSPW